MITKTSLLATRALLCLAMGQQGLAMSPRSIAEQLGESPAYMAKVLRSLVKSGILRAERGSHGGVLLNRRPGEITLLAIVEACQGAIVGNYCQEIRDLATTCAFHRAAYELREAVVGVLSRCKLDELARTSGGPKCLEAREQCLMVTFPLPAGEPKKGRAVAGKRARS